MKLRPLVLALLLGAACSAAACSSNLAVDGAVAGGPIGEPDEDSGSPDEDGGSNRDQEAGAVDANTKADAGEKDAAAYASDPLNCGASAHSCLGGACTNGVCAAEKLRSGAITDWLSFDESGALVSLVRPTTNGVQELRRGPATASAIDDVVFKGTGETRFFQGEGRVYKSGALFSVFGTPSVSPPNPLWKFTGSGGADASATLIDSGNLTLLGVDAAALYFARLSKVYRMPLAGTSPIELATSPVSVRSGIVDGSNLYVASVGRSFARIPTSGGTPSAMNVTGIDTGNGKLQIVGATATDLVASLFMLTSADCKTFVRTFYLVPKSGGPATTWDSFLNDSGGEVAVSGDHIYWSTSPCGGGEHQILRRRTDKTDAAVVIATIPGGVGYPQNLVVHGSYVHWIHSFNGEVWRAAR